MHGEPTPQFRGDLQAEVMAAVWKLGEATVDDVRAQQPARSRSAYSTVQTVLNRLVERGLLERTRRRKAYVYQARYGEAEYLSHTLAGHLSDADPDVRRAALVNLVDTLEPAELDEIARYANRIRRKRQQK